MAESKKTLENRLFDFLNSLPGSECLDTMTLTAEQSDAKKADFLLENRSYVVECKSFKVDPEYKVEEVIKPYRALPEWPVFFGQWDVEKVLKHLPDPQEIRRKLFMVVTSAIEDKIRDANRQIRETKRAFAIPEASGLLVILNESAHILSPDLIVNRVGAAFQKKTPAGKPRFPEVVAAWVLNSTHYLQLTPSLKSFASMLVDNIQEVEDPARVKDYAWTLMGDWARFSNLPLLDLKLGDHSVGELPFLKDRAGNETLQPLRRQDIWILEYQKHPYLLNLGRMAFIQYGQTLFLALASTMLKEGPAVTEAERNELLELWAHMLVEVNNRGSDFKTFQLNRLGLKSMTITRKDLEKWQSQIRHTLRTLLDPH